MVIAVILTIIALIYAINHRDEPLKTIYAGIALSACSVMFFILFYIIQVAGQSFGWAVDPVATALFQSTLALIPAGTVIAMAGIILHYRKSKS